MVSKVPIRGEEELGKVVIFRRVAKVEKSYGIIPIFRRGCGSSVKTCCLGYLSLATSRKFHCPQMPLIVTLQKSYGRLATLKCLLMSFHATLHHVTIFKRVVKALDPPCIMSLYSKEVKKHRGSLWWCCGSLRCLRGSIPLPHLLHRRF